MLQIKGITKKYVSDTFEQIALNNVSMNFRKSEFVSILGQSGSGKTTLLNIIGGLDKYNSGDLIINGISTKEYSDKDWDAYRNYSIGFVFQSYNLIGHQSILSNVEMALTLSGVKKSERKARAKDALIQVGLGNHIHKRPNQLSGGQMQRVAIARALVNDPDIILADEPTGALDSDTSVQIMEILKNVSREKLVIMVTHNPELAQQYSTRIISVKDGNVVGDTNPYSNQQYAIDTNGMEGYPWLQRTNPLSDARLNARSISISNGNVPPPKRIIKEIPQKTSMSFLTALSLSLNNLMTKKGRTLLTAVAGSIGIIGIALILAISTGVNNYIDVVQKDALAGSPIMIQQESTDLSSLLGDLTSGMEKDPNRKENELYVKTSTFDMLKSSMTGEASKNNLKAFKKYLEEHKDEINSYTMSIQYLYDLKLNIYNKDPNGEYIKADFEDVVKEVMGGGKGDAIDSTAAMYSSMGGVELWQELVTDPTTGNVSNLIMDDYDVVHGKWPSAENELILVVNGQNDISEMALYTLGLIDKPTMIKATAAALTKKDDNSFDAYLKKSWTYEQICNQTLKLVLPTDYYKYNESTKLWEDKSNDQAFVKDLIEKGIELKIVGIVKPKDPDGNNVLTAAFCYMPSFSKMYIDKVNNSEIIKQQTSSENSNRNVLTGLPFTAKTFEVSKDLPQADKAKKFKEFVSTLSDLEKADVYYNILSKPSDADVQKELDEVMKKYQEKTSEEIITLIQNDYAAFLGYSNDLIKNMLSGYTKEQLIDYVKKTAKDAILQNYKDSAMMTISGIKGTPSDEKLTELKNKITNEMFAKIADLPLSQQNSEKLNIQIEYIAQNWMVSTNMDPEAIMSYLYGLSNSEVEKIFDELITQEATQKYSMETTSSSDAEDNKKVAKAFDEYLKDCKEEKLAYYYENHMVSSTSSKKYDEVLKDLGCCSIDDPITINLYPKDFESKNKITNMIDEYNKNVKDEKDKITYSDMVEFLMKSISTIIDAISIVLICFVSISLVVSSIMIGIITYISVLERTKEIGILRAVGASKNDIARVFNAETMIVGFLAGAIGILTTVLLCIPITVIAQSLTKIDNIYAVLPWYGYLLIVLSMGLTFIAGLFPSMMAAKKDPVIALRSE